MSPIRVSTQSHLADLRDRASPHGVAVPTSTTSRAHRARIDPRSFCARFSGAMRSFDATAREFRRYHSNSFNVALHLATTPTAMACALALVEGRLGRDVARGIVWAYLVATAMMLDCGRGLKAATATATWATAYASTRMTASGMSEGMICATFVAAYVGQELAHIATGEKTYQQSYMKFSNWPALLVEHTFYLLPLCLDAVMHMKESFLSWIVAHNYVVRAKLTSGKDRAAMKVIENFVTEEDPDRSCTAHWWHTRLAPKEKDAFTHIAHSEPIEGMFAKRFRPDAWVVKPVYGMNEIYVASSHHNNNSDTVFYMEHVDGPWAVYPFCFLYRCMLAVNENVKVSTNFTHEGSGGCLSDGDVVGFDFHREIHVISDLPVENPDRRITMKLHYCVYPRCFGIFGEALLHLSVMYNTVARRLFLNTIKPTGIWRFMAFMVLTVTHGAFLVSKYAGISNIASVIALYAIGQYVHPYFFFAMTSYTHYCMYIATYHVRDRVNFGMFKRNVMFWKTLALTHLGTTYLKNFEFDLISLAMIICGYGLSTAATVALGIDQTYFGVELGEVEPNYVHGFPYDVVPHPMIIGSMVGLLGFHKMAGFRAALPYAIPMHCTMYFIHMVQEQINDIYAANWKGDDAEDAKTATHRTPVRKSSSKSPKRTPSRTPKKTTSTSSRTPKRTPSQKAPARKTPSRSASRRTSVAA